MAHRMNLALVMLAPATGLIAVFVFIPMALTIWLSLQAWSTQTGFETARFVGLQNFIDIFGPTTVGRDFKTALTNTAVYTVLSVAIILPLSIAFGLLVHQKVAPGGVFLRTVLFSTYMVPMIAVALVFSKLYSPSEGPLNQILEWLGLPASAWLSSPRTALASIVLLNVWQQVGYFTVLAVAGLTQIPAAVLEAATVDGANPVQRFAYITLPLLANTLLFSAVIAIINAVQVFEPVALITQGGPVNSTNVLTYHIRRVRHRAGSGGAGIVDGGDFDAGARRLHCCALRIHSAARGRRMIEGLTPRPALERWRRRTPLGALVLTLIIFVAVVAAFPLAWMVLTSLKTPQETMSVPPVWLPASPSLDAYRKVADVLSLGRSFLNSGVIALVTTTAIDVTSLMAGYAFAKYDFRFRDPLFAILIATMFLPPIVTLIPLYRIVGYLGLNASLIGVVAPNLANAFGIFLMRQFIKGVPNELIEAARLDGASELRLLFQIVAPAVFPALAALTLFAFVYHWNSYLWPLTVLEGNTRQYPIVVSLSRLLSYNRGAMNTALVMAGATLAVLPPVLLFVLLQRFFVNSIVASGING